MKKILNAICELLLKVTGAVAIFAQTWGASAGAAQPAGTLLTSDATWNEVKTLLSSRPEALAELKTKADNYLTMEPESVTDKKTPPPGGDIHNYTSIAPYSWPNPKTPDGLPYITRDGETNPEFYNYDNTRLEKLCAAVPHLVLCGYVTGNPAYMEKAGKLLKVWFLDPATRMNPNLRYAQFIPGVTDGRCIGIIDTTSFIFLLDAAVRIPWNSEWQPEDLKGLQRWFSDYLDWLRDSPFGREEEARPNNHGSWYDAQLVTFAAFTGRNELIKPQVETWTRKRIAAHIRPDGSQPKELARTLSLTYSSYNLLALACTAEIARREGIDLWSYRPEKAGSLEGALNYLAPSYVSPENWTHPQIKPFAVESAALLFTLAWQGTGNRERRDYPDHFAPAYWRVLFSKGALSGRKIQ